MALFKRIDSFDVTFADSFASPELKITEQFVHRNGKQAKKGVGEKRIYCGHDEVALDKFFQLDKSPKFFIQKDDLEEYYKEIEKEYINPQYRYGSGDIEILEQYKNYGEKLKSLKQERLYISFNKTYDSQQRYYLVLPKRNKESMEYHKNWEFIRDICLPRVTRLLFVQLIDIESKDIYIYIKPFYGEKITGTKTSDTSKVTAPLKDEKGDKYRKGQEKYRESILSYYPYCVVTNVTDPNLLTACHIKDYASCEKDEQYDQYNGLTMTPTIHTLFDLGYLTFDETGKMILSDFFRNMDRRNLNLIRKVQIVIRDESRPYLKWHNEHTFIRTSKGVEITND